MLANKLGRKQRQPQVQKKAIAARDLTNALAQALRQKGEAKKHTIRLLYAATLATPGVVAFARRKVETRGKTDRNQASQLSESDSVGGCTITRFA